VAPPRWTTGQLERAREQAIGIFRHKRLEEDPEAYLSYFDEYQARLEGLLERTADLSELEEEETALAILTDPPSLEAFRYLAAPPISTDDLKILAEAESLSPRTLRANRELVGRVITTVRAALDRRRFVWVTDNREPTEAERHGAILASAALMAGQRLETQRRNEEKTAQEQQVKKALKRAGFREVPTRRIRTFADAPEPGQFCGESLFGSRKADIVIGLWDKRAMLTECKVSNSALNSIKRLNNDAAIKAERWRREFGEAQVVPTAVLSGVYHLPHLEAAQDRGLTIIWAHDLNALLTWIRSTRR
jgi:hypothetical protein